MTEDIVEVPLGSGLASLTPAPNPSAQNNASTNPPPPTDKDDLMNHFDLSDKLVEMRHRKIRSSFMHYIAELPNDNVPLKPRCPGGLLGEIARQPVNEDERALEDFDEQVLRAALTFKETDRDAVKMPEWLDEEQPWGDDERKKKKKDKKKKKKKKKRKRSGDDDDGRLDEEEKRLKKKRK